MGSLEGTLEAACPRCPVTVPPRRFLASLRSSPVAPARLAGKGGNDPRSKAAPCGLPIETKHGVATIRVVANPIAKDDPIVGLRRALERHLEVELGPWGDLGQ